MTPTEPGTYLYADPGAAPEPLVLVLDGDVLCARFSDEENGEELVPVQDMAGVWQPLPA
jgi:hypothetical protein